MPVDAFDVVVVGAGPAGSSAAVAARGRGANTLLLERHRLPRYKMCGGGLIGPSLGALPSGFAVPVVNDARRVYFTYDLVSIACRTASETVLPMVMRSDLDRQLVEHALGQGVELRDEVTVDGVEGAGPGYLVHTNKGTVRARAVIGADGSASRIARMVGAAYAQVDLGMEAEVQVPSGIANRWAGKTLLDFGRVPGGYAWVFPKGDVLTVGVIAAKGLAAQQRAYLADLLSRLGLAEFPRIHEGGHLTRCRRSDSPLARDGAFLAGDAAGLLEPWTREGISFALRSGNLAGQSAAAWADGDTRACDEYTRLIDSTLGREMAVGFRALRAYTRHPRVFFLALSGTNVGWDSFVRLARGETTWERVGRRRSVQLALDILGGS